MRRLAKSYRPRRPFRHLVILVVAVQGALLLSSCTITRGSGPFRSPELLESGLTRGVSTKADVRRLLGDPTGTCSALLPGQPGSRETWCYESSELISKSDGLRERGQIALRFRQQVLLVVFNKELLDGYMWHTNKVAGGM
jgi:hypothetical protein